MTDKYLKGQNSRVHLVLMKPFNELEILYAIEMAEKFHNQNDAFFSDEQDTVISAEYMFIKGKSLKKGYHLY
jgi:hypothetical protein